MLKNYLKIAWRNLKRNKGYSVINIGGLAVGIMVVMLIGLWITAELSFNTYHNNYERIAQVWQHQTNSGKRVTQNSIPAPMGPELENSFGGNFEHVVMSSFTWEHILSKDDKKLTEKGNYMDVGAPEMLSLKMLQGSRDGLKKLNSILLSESLANSFFGNQDPIGKVVEVDNELNVVVTGVYEDLPISSEFSDIMFIAPWKLYTSSVDWVKSAIENPRWDDNSYQLYVQVAANTNFETVNRKIKNIKYDKLDASQKALKTEIFLHPMADWHLKSSWKNGVQTGGFIRYVWLFGIIGFFILLLACVNFMNLSTANSVKRNIEIGIRKSLGSNKGQLVNQFLSESIVVVFISFCVALLMVLIVLPFFNQLAGKQIVFPYNNFVFWLICLSSILLVGLLAGSYPALYLSSFKPVKVLKGSFKAGRSVSAFRKVLVVWQFTVSVILIVGTIVVREQIEHSKERPLGYDKEGLIIMEISTSDYEGKYNLLRNELKNRNAIVEMSESSSPLTAAFNSNDGFSWEGKDPGFNAEFANFYITHDYGKTVDWEIVEGRDFSREFSTDSTAYIINEAAVKYMGLENPVGKIIKWGNSEHKIIGVVRNMLSESPYESVKHAIYMIDYVYNANYIELKLNPDKSASEALAIVKDVFTEYVPAVPFEYQFVNQNYAKKFAEMERIGKLSGIFSLLAIFISCLGLIGLASFMAEQRTKEIGIRKVLGASVMNLWAMLSKDFIGLVLISVLVATPIAWYFMGQWLESYAYRIEISWWIFAIAGMSAFIITVLTVSFQVIRAAISDPVKSLRTE
ncbi:ABC transporter permease [Flagellimonas aquimarina]|uniref:ABC transporter permease n=1 Tax=Flagellimonas aquimarina TaxID=2201895 RepID=A0A316L2F1_9FLAO|nr:ABC transporter permease [Allomuricauda koreensis]PWL38403.1 ABC transporter permease [Allomuricauda koreensis]